MHRTHTCGFAHWHADLPKHATSPDLRDWLTHRGSLTARLIAHSEQFNVQRLHQQSAPCLPDEAGVMGLLARARVVQREVLLRCDGVAVVYAHTVLPSTANASQWPLFASLGNKSLGSTLFNDPLVVRGALHYCRLPQTHPLMRRIAALHLWTPGMPSLYARRSLFTRHGSSLLVTEVFLPTISGLRTLNGRQK